MMFQQKSTETVTLTKTQLKAILELMTQMGGINNSESWDEPKVNYKNDNKITYNRMNQETENQLRSNHKLYNKNNNYWEREREDMLDRDDWYSLKNNKEQRNSYAPIIMANDNQIPKRLLSSTASNSSKGEDSRVNSVMTNESSNESNFRRYSRINDSEFDLNALQQKRIKASEYGRALDKQMGEKQQKKFEEKQRVRIEDELLDKKIREERLGMKNAYEIEQKLLEEKKAIAERKREAVIAAIEKTKVIKKRNFLADEEPEETNSRQQQTQPVLAVATIRPQARTKETYAQTDRQSFYPKNCDVGTQTDVQLLLRLIQEMSIISDPTDTLNNDSTSIRISTPKIQKKSSENQRSKSSLNSGNLSNRPVWGTNQLNKSYVKNGNKASTPKSLEMRKRFREKESQIQSKITNNDTEVGKDYDKDNSIALNNKDKLNSETQPMVISRPLRRNSLSASVKNISEYHNQKRMSIDHKTNFNFLPQISARPHSRKKWYSQEAFNPNFLT